MTDSRRRDLGHVFNEVPELYDQVRPGYPPELPPLPQRLARRPTRGLTAAGIAG